MQNSSLFQQQPQNNVPHNPNLEYDKKMISALAKYVGGQQTGDGGASPRTVRARNAHEAESEQKTRHAHRVQAEKHKEHAKVLYGAHFSGLQVRAVFFVSIVDSPSFVRYCNIALIF
jgi:hypothetical protein